MRSDQDIYSDIGTLLYSIAPDDAVKIIMRAKWCEETEYCEYEYDYVDYKANTQWFTAGGLVNSAMLHYLVELRKYYIEHQLTNGKAIWEACEASFDIEKMKIIIDFKYDD